MSTSGTSKHLQEAPDGGWGWLVVLSSFLSHIVVPGTLKSFGVFFPYMLQAFEEDAESTAWISSIQAALTMFGSVVAGALSNVFGCRAVVMAGGLVAAVGLLSSMFVTSLPVMYLTAGFITGLGFSFMYTPCITMVGRYFKKRRALANGLGLSGAGVGTFAFPPVFQLLIDHYGWRGSLFVVAGVALQGCIFGALLRPIYLIEDFENRKTVTSNDEKAPSRRRCFSLCRLLDLSLFRKPYFVVFILSNMLLIFGNFIPFVHLVAHARNVGTGAQEAAFLISVIGIGDGVSRIAYGWLSDLGLFPRLRGYTVCALGLALSVFFLPQARTYSTMVACCLAVGLFAGSCASQTAVFLAEFCGVGRLASAVGIAYGIQGFAMLFGPPIAGRLYDVTGNYTASFYVAGSVVMVCVLMLTSLEVHRTRTISQLTNVLPRTHGITENTESCDFEKDTDERTHDTCTNDDFIMHESSV
ncbi:PREDICTED: monocarboxylate transporter 13-like [Branchiostoma belcheri]|uniref:Monocarboxylate transporter 13-like n=1 Tax=Branchiostoma belcheri TaxID=7741 RepID=A0A6P4YVV3_BRABE|nr:PREDICTED: monocarboxylate transporter 13-like [Branchiostoma belcheri]